MIEGYMMKFLGFFTVATALLMSAPTDGMAQTSVTGDWTFSISSPQGDFDLPVTITQEGETLALVGRGEFSPLVMTGALEGSEVSWSWDLDFQGTPLDVVLAGTVMEGSMSGFADFGGLAEGSWSASRD